MFNLVKLTSDMESENKFTKVSTVIAQQLLNLKIQIKIYKTVRAGLPHTFRLSSVSKH